MNEKSKVSYHWVDVHSVPIHVLKCGSWKNGVAKKSIFVIIPGNPGCMGFYNEFALALFQRTKVPVWGVSHSGHVSGSSKQHPEKDDCGLESQIEHKIWFMKQNVLPFVDKVYLIGHSIGCYIILHILDRMNDHKLEKGIMLFPTIERMSETPKGKWMTPALVYGRWVFLAFSWFLSLLPQTMKRYLVEYLFRSTNELSKQAVLFDVLNPQATDCITFMGLQEMKMVNARDDRIIGSQADKLIFYFGAKDHWSPVSYYAALKKDFPEVDIRLCKMGYRHAFVLRESEEVAEIVHDMWTKF